MARIGYLGPKGTFSQEALELYVGGKVHTAVEYATIAEVLAAVQNGTVEEAVVPIENSIEGAVNVTMDMMASEAELKIKAELVIAVRQNLLVKKGTACEQIRSILSHPQPLGQCRKYIQERFPRVEIKYTYSTAGAAEDVAKGPEGMAAIGSSAAAHVYGLEILESGIQDDENNRTRFVVIASKDSERTGSDKTSIVFSTEDKPGSLYRVLDIFNLWDINMARIESRPAKNQLGRYIFFIDINGHRDDEDIRDALTMIKRKVSFYKFLGSYPAFEAQGRS